VISVDKIVVSPPPR